MDDFAKREYKSLFVPIDGFHCATLMLTYTLAPEYFPRRAVYTLLVIPSSRYIEYTVDSDYILKLTEKLS